MRAGKTRTRYPALLSPALAIGGYLGFLAGVNLFRVIPADKVTVWDYLLLGTEALALLLGKDTRQTSAGRAGMVIATLLLVVEVLRAASLLAWPGTR